MNEARGGPHPNQAGLAFRRAVPTSQLRLTVKPAVGRVIMPAVRLGDGSWRQDSALICDEATTPPPADPLLSPLGVTLPSSRHILAPRVYRALLA